MKPESVHELIAWLRSVAEERFRYSSKMRGWSVSEDRIAGRLRLEGKKLNRWADELESVKTVAVEEEHQ